MGGVTCNRGVQLLRTAGDHEPLHVEATLSEDVGVVAASLPVGPAWEPWRQPAIEHHDGTGMIPPLRAELIVERGRATTDDDQTANWCRFWDPDGLELDSHANGFLAKSKVTNQG